LLKSEFFSRFAVDLFLHQRTSLSPSAVVAPQETLGKTRHSALVSIGFWPVEEWQESVLILLNWEEVKHQKQRLEQVWANSGNQKPKPKSQIRNLKQIAKGENSNLKTQIPNRVLRF